MSSSLEQIVMSTRSLSSAGDFKELVTLLPKHIEILTRNHQHLDNVLETLDLSHHTIGMLAVMYVKMNLFANSNNSTLEQFKLLLPQLQEFIHCCNKEQISFAWETFADLCHLITNQLIDFGIPITGIKLMMRAIKKLQSKDTHLTAVHADLCKLCLASKCLKPALKYLEKDISQIDTGEDAKQFLLYFYYGGMIYTALKKYEKALYCFEVCTMTPAQAISHIMVEAYKKFMLVSPILIGKVQFLPNYTCNLVKRHVKRLCAPYVELSNVYCTNNCDEMKRVIRKYEESLIRDKNLGLANQVLNSLYKKNIQRLTNTFLTLSLTDVAARVKLSNIAEAEKYILNMIEDAEIFAVINQTDGMVVFLDDPEKYNSPRMLAKLEKEMEECVELGKKVLKMEEEVITAPIYIRKVCGGNEQEEQALANSPAQNATTTQVQGKQNTYTM
ncbi:COP9 signalosome complex subunit 3 [Trichogramma pretiosum]|uniref:COP9 signalosome complex subunit 3 n=1 Tax=Trichogramma pretiosum TaxID=7493 RepID=UPI0006C981ED|nr:COP9 signalosome complex subunit 3 [Trichogramma pretiosum]